MKASLIIPSYNACERLYYNLLELNNQAYPRDKFEVILVNNGSTDDTELMLKSFSPNYKLTVVKLPIVMSRAYARNKGIMEAKNDLIIFHDSDMLASKDFIRKHIESHKNYKTIVCGKLESKIFTYYYTDFNDEQTELLNKQMGSYIDIKDKTTIVDKKALISKAQVINGSYEKYHFDVELYYNKVLEKYGRNLDGFNFEWLFFVTRNCSVSKKALLEVGLFDERFVGWGAEDTDLGYRLFEKGYKLIVNPDIISIHQEHPKSSSDLEHTDTNRALLIKKHNSINLLLYFLYKYFDLNSNELNHVMSDINKVQAKKGSSDLILLFQNALIDLRNKVFENSTPEPPANYNMKSIAMECSTLIHDYYAIHFVRALLKLVKKLYGISITI